MGRGLVFIGTERGVPKLKPTDFEVDVEFPPPRIIAVPGNFQTVRVQAVALNAMPYDQAEVNFQSGPKTDPDANEYGDVQGEGPVPFGGSNSRHWIVLIRCEDVLDRMFFTETVRARGS